MSEQEIKDRAPSGATHYNPKAKSAIYYKIENGRYKFYCRIHNLWYGSAYFLDDENIKPL